MRRLWDRPAVLCGLVGLLAGLAMLANQAAAGGKDDGSTLKVKEGQPAPNVELPATQIETVLPGKKDAKTLRLSEFKGKKNVVLYFYPKALTGGWTAEACGFRDRLEQFAQLDTVIIGISTDPLALQKKFTEKEKLTFPLYADTELKAAKAFGVLIPGRKMAKRVTFVINKQGNIAKIYAKVGNAGAHPEEVLEYVKSHLAPKK